jgi:site-specific recombinase XerD
MPTRVKVPIDAWTAVAGVTDGHVFRAVNRGGQAQAVVLSEKVVWQLLQGYATAAGVRGIAPYDLRRSLRENVSCRGRELEQIQLLLRHVALYGGQRAPF